MNKTVILTGLRANNDLHIGNYLGALLPIIDLAKTRAGEYQVNLFIPDLHSFTTPIEHDSLQSGIMNNLKSFIAAGLPIDNPEVFIYRQSYIPAHSELTWILDCFTGMGEMQRMTQFKDKSTALGTDRVSVGLFNYPVLMAADVLLYNASYIPVGDDQTQHLEFIRDLAERINTRFGTRLTIPKSVKEQQAFLGSDQGIRIKDLGEPTKKMSKSDVSGKGVIFLNDSPEAAEAKIMSATTDSLGKILYNQETQPGVTNLIELLALISKRGLNEVRKEYEGQSQYGPLKGAVAEHVKRFLIDYQSKLNLVDEVRIMDKLKSSELQMNIQANATLLKVQSAVGLRN